MYVFIFFGDSVQVQLLVSDALQLHGLQHARLPCPSPTPGVYFPFIAIIKCWLYFPCSAIQYILECILYPLVCISQFSASFCPLSPSLLATPNLFSVSVRPREAAAFCYIHSELYFLDSTCKWYHTVLKVYGNPASSKCTGNSFPTALAPLCLCVAFGWFSQYFKLLLIVFVTVVCDQRLLASLLQLDEAQMMASNKAF